MKKRINQSEKEKFWALGEKGIKFESFQASNKEMLKEAEFVIMFWDGKSVGTKDMLDLTISEGVDHLLINYKGL